MSSNTVDCNSESRNSTDVNPVPLNALLVLIDVFVFFNLHI